MITCHMLQNTGDSKKNVMLQPPFLTKNRVLQLAFFRKRNIDVARNNNTSNQATSKDKDKGFEKENKIGNQKKKGLLREKHCN